MTRYTPDQGAWGFIKYVARHGQASAARRLMMLGLGLGCILRGYSYGFYEGQGPPALNGGPIILLGPTFGIVGIALLWILAGLFGLYSAIRARHRWATAFMGGMFLLWGCGYLASSVGLVDGRDTDWISASTYLSMAIFIWGSSRLVDTPTYARIPREAAR